MNQSNSLKYSTSKTFKGQFIKVFIQLDDECKNGHQDFNVTGEVYEANKPICDKNMISCGCVHDEILRAFPEFKIFVDLHLCDYLGIPMHCTANGYYHLQNGFNSTKPDNNSFKNEFCNYYRVTPNEFNILNTSKSEIQFYLHLKELQIFDHWKAQANHAIETLEYLTDTTFIIDSKRTQLHAPTEEEINVEQQRIKEGYYTPAAEQQRYQNKVNAKIKEMADDIEEKHQGELFELELKKQIILIGGFEALDDCIYYDHTKTIAFNWQTYSKGIDKSLFDKIASEIILPEGVNIEFKLPK